jgi:hypothetical protein
LNIECLYSLPESVDDEGNAITVASDVADGDELPSFITFSESAYNYKIKPRFSEEIGTTEVQVTLSDDKGASSTYTFTVNVFE